MADNVEMQGLEFQIVNDSTQAVRGLEKLSRTLESLKSATRGGISGVSSAAKAIERLSTAFSNMNASETGQKVAAIRAAIASLQGLNGVTIPKALTSRLSELNTALGSMPVENINKLTNLGTGLNALNQAGSVRISSSIANQLTAINTALGNLKWTDGDKLTALANGLRPLSELGKANMTTFINQLGKLPAVVAELDKIDLDKFADQLNRISTALRPLATEMQRVSDGFSSFPSKIQKVISSANQLTSNSGGLLKNKSGLSSLFKILTSSAIAKAGKAFSKVISSSNKYLEDMNLFTVALGEYASEAQEYAEKVSELMGIDPADWMRNQGVFNTLLSGFGSAADRAALMSKNLTQLGYDLSSFYNISVEDAMQKLQSGVAGELEPLRRLGYDLSVARLEQERLRLGIDKSVSSMTQAEKAELRYYSIMTQVTVAQGDMARTLESPTNQLRILKAQVEQTARAIGNIFIPVLNAILPYAIAVIKVIRELVGALASLVGFEMTEVDYSGVNNAAVGAGELADNLSDAAGAAKKLQQYTLGFDELNVFSQNDQSGVGAGVGAGSGGFDFELPTYDFVQNAVSANIDAITKQIEDNLAAIELLIAGALFNIGAVLVLLGHPGWGIGLMIAGGMMGVAAVATNWDSLTNEAKVSLGALMELIGIGLFTFGAILLLAGHPALGIALMVAGTTSTAGGAVIKWNYLEDPVQNVLDNLDNILTIGSMAIGAILAFSGVNLPVGIALLAAGAVRFAASAALNWGALEPGVKDAIGLITAALTIGMLAVGAVLAFGGINIPLGLALMAGGALILTKTITPNWKNLSTTTQNTITNVSKFVGKALLGLGAIIALASANIPLGIALMASGAITLASAAHLNWNSVKNTIKTVVSGIAGILSGALIVLGVILCLSGVGIGLGLAVLAAGLAGSYAAWTLDDNPITRFVKNMANSVISLINKVIEAINDLFHIQFKGFSVAGIELIPAFDIKLLNIPLIPKFEDGGFVDEGQLFIAREAGAEMVGAMGRRTAVANNDQIVEGISAGVSIANDGVISAIYALMNVVEDKDMVVNIGDNQIGQSYDRYKNRRGRQVSTGAFANAY